MSTQRKNRLFVYGTLQRGHANHALLAAAQFVAPAQVVGSYAMWGEGFPRVAAVMGGHGVAGELYHVSDDELARCDALEGHPQWYCRQEVPILVRSEVTRDYVDAGRAWMYLQPSMPADGGAVAPDEDGVLRWRRGDESPWRRADEEDEALDGGECPGCGGHVDDDWHFCAECGQELRGDE